MKLSRKKYALIPEDFTPAARIGLIAILFFLLAAPFSLFWSTLPLLLFIATCFIAPFLPGFSFFLPIVSRGPSNKQAVAITFDDGPNPVTTPALLGLLTKHKISATFYVTGSHAEQHPALVQKMVSLGHTIGNHSYSHDNFIMLKRSAVLKREIEKTQDVLSRLEVYPLTFRPPVGITNPKLGHILKKMKLYAVNFSCRAGDMGNRKIRHLSKKILRRLRSGDIIMLHDTPPRKGGMTTFWLNEIDRLLSEIRKKNLEIIPLATLIDRPVMARQEPVARPVARPDARPKTRLEK